ncbi:MAG: hypothetical protein PGN34_18350 [Methylobacterium frigidaeris]
MSDTLASCTIALNTREADTAGEKWVHLLPAGTFTGRDGRGPYRVTNPDRVIAVSRHLAGRTQIPVDYEHQIDFAAKNGASAPASGWIKGLQSRADGIWGLVEWTARAAGHIAAREYRYLSPAFRHTPDGEVTAILRASLVNNPNLDQLTALASMESTMSEPKPGDGLGELRTALGLDAAADTAAMLAAVRELTTSRNTAGRPDPAAYVPIGDFLRVTQELRRVNQGVEHQVALNHVEEQIRAGRLFPYLKEWGVELCSINKPAFDDLIAKMGGTVRAIVEPSRARLQPPAFAPSGGPDLNDTDAHVASVLGLSTEDFSKAGRK